MAMLDGFMLAPKRGLSLAHSISSGNFGSFNFRLFGGILEIDCRLIFGFFAQFSVSYKPFCWSNICVFLHR